MSVHRRSFLQIAAGIAGGTLMATETESPFDDAIEPMRVAVNNGLVSAASVAIGRRGVDYAWTFGQTASLDSKFLVASISKPMAAAAVMKLCDTGDLNLDDPVDRYLPEFRGDGRETITIRQLLTHTSGLPDQLPENDSLRRRHAPLSEFVRLAVLTPLRFRPGSQYAYSSMGILIAAEVAERITGKPFRQWMVESVFEPLEMNRSALGLGRWRIDEVIACQVEKAAVEAGAGASSALDWDWNSQYWRDLGAPWGGVHASAGDIRLFFDEFLHPTGRLFSAESAAEMTRSQLPPKLTPRGLGFGLGPLASSSHCSERSFGHSGSTGTFAWSDPVTDTTLVVLTTLPGAAVNPHPRKLVSDSVARSVS